MVEEIRIVKWIAFNGVGPLFSETSGFTLLLLLARNGVIGVAASRGLKMIEFCVSDENGPVSQGLCPHAQVDVAECDLEVLIESTALGKHRAPHNHACRGHGGDFAGNVDHDVVR